MATLSMNQAAIRKAKAAAKEFAKKWLARPGDEKQECAAFWLELLRTVYGVRTPEDIVLFEDRVKVDHTRFIDARIPSTRVMIEQKSADVDLAAPQKQSGGAMLTPYEQAKRYADSLSFDDRARWIVTCNFREFRVHDLNRKNPAEPVSIIALAELPTFYHRLFFLTDTQSQRVEKEKEVSMRAGELISRVYNAMLARYKNPNDADTLRHLNKFCVRLVFCLYAEDAEIFAKDQFLNYLSNSNPREVRERIKKLFFALNQRREERDQYDEELLAFPYVNGGLFAEPDMEIPLFDAEMVQLILDEASAGFDWSDISPTIFGGLFESTLNPETRRSGGMHYTSIENIHKVIDPLFLDALKEELDAILNKQQSAAKRKENLLRFQDKLATLTFLDPACGSGNFLTETYISLRRLENEALRAMSNGQGEFGGEFSKVRVSIQQFHGIEINDFAVSVAKTAMWIASAQTWRETQEFSTQELGDFLPLETYDNIREGNALRLDWLDPLPNRHVDYIMGNPPFVGYTYQSKEQKEDMQHLFCNSKAAGKYDFVAAWFARAAEVMKNDSQTRAALVSTNSVTQGESVGTLWYYLITEKGIHIDFAYRTFKWSNEAKNAAAVHCVIIGFSCGTEHESKLLFDEHGNATSVKHINPYLTASNDVFVSSRSKPLCDVPILVKGSQPTDNGNFLFSEEEKNDFILREPRSALFMRKFLGGREFLNAIPRYTLWFVSADMSIVRKCPLLLERLNAVQEFRLRSTKEATRKCASTPYLYQENRQPVSNFVVIPEVSSERRAYIPMGFLTPDIICSNKLQLLPDATLYHFGVLTSTMHMAWTRAVCGRLKSDYDYSNKVVYNNFPWPTATVELQTMVEVCAQAVLDARALYPNRSLADLYDPLTMPSELLSAHRKLDAAVEKAYGRKFKDDSDRVAFLFEEYKKLAEK